MAKEFAKQFYNSTAWKKCRKSYISSVHGLCERCLKEGRLVNGYIVHHKILLTPNNIGDVNITLNHKHLEYVCKECHDEEHGVGNIGRTVRKGLKFNDLGELVKVT